MTSKETKHQTAARQVISSWSSKGRLHISPDGALCSPQSSMLESLPVRHGKAP